MVSKYYRQLSLLVLLMMLSMIGVATIQDSYPKAAVWLLVVVMLMIFLRSKKKTDVDERQVAVDMKAFRTTMAIYTPAIGAAVFLINQLGLKMFYRVSPEHLFVYLNFILMGVYSLSYFIINRQHNRGQNDPQAEDFSGDRWSDTDRSG